MCYIILRYFFTTRIWIHSSIPISLEREILRSIEKCVCPDSGAIEIRVVVIVVVISYICSIFRHFTASAPAHVRPTYSKHLRRLFASAISPSFWSDCEVESRPIIALIVSNCALAHQSHHNGSSGRWWHYVESLLNRKDDRRSHLINWNEIIWLWVKCYVSRVERIDFGKMILVNPHMYLCILLSHGVSHC